MVKVKICGNTSIEDALECVKLGADAIGTVVEVPVDTPRKISIETAGKIFSKLPVFTPGIAVIMPKNASEVVYLLEKIKPHAIQLHGDESLDFVRGLKGTTSCKIIKTLHVKDESVIEKAVEFSGCCDAILLDSASEKMGGSGITHNWNISKEVVKSVGIPVILAGGLKPENVEDAIRKVRPYGVDVSSGVEEKPGKKDFDKVRRFIINAKKA